MTAGKAIETADALRPNNSFDRELKILWLRQSDAALRRAVVSRSDTTDFDDVGADVLYDPEQELLRQDGMQLIYNPPEEEIPLVPGDPERLKQVFLNILDNAAKYARDGKTIEVSVFSDSEAATIQFRDHGPGIPENELPHVKEKFFKGEKHKARGSGIGLAVCDEIITRSGGTLTIANAPGGGTLVSVRLPFAPESGN